MAGAAHQFAQPHQFVDLVARAAPVGDLVHHVASAAPCRRGRACRSRSSRGRRNARNCARLRTCRVAPPNTMKAPAVGTSSKAMRRLNSSGVISTPEGPLICTAATSRAPQSCEHLGDGHAERIFVNARPLAIAGDRNDLGAGRIPGAAPRETRAAVDGDFGRLRKRLDVVDDGRPPEIAGGDGQRRSDARTAGFALQRFDQRRLLAADIGAGAEVDLDVEIEPGRAADGGPRRRSARIARVRPPAWPSDIRIRRANRGSRASRRPHSRRSPCPRTRGRHAKSAARGP